MNEDIGFGVIETNKLPWAVNPMRVFSICPTMDLIAFSAQDGSVWIYRIDGQRVWILSTPESEIEMLEWRPDGKMLAVVSVDGIENIFDSNTGKLVQTLNKSLDSIHAVTWSKRSKRFGESSKFEDLFDINISKSLTRLSTLPNGSTASTFTAKIINDEMIQCDDSSLDFLISAGDSGKLTFTLYGIFTLEEFQVPQLQDTYVTICDIRSNSLLSSHYILLERQSGLGLLKLDTHFVDTLGALLPTVSLACSKIVSLLSYIQESIDILVREVKPFIDYKSRIMGLLKEEMISKSLTKLNENEVEPIDDLYDLLLTGMINEASKVWVTDYLGDRGLKRWMRLGKQCYDGSRKLLFYHLVPAIEHLIVLLSSLLGYSRWNTSSSKNYLGLEEKNLTHSIAAAASLTKSIHRFIFKINEEQQGFETFLDWLTCVLKEITDDEPVIDDMAKTKEIANYMSTGLLSSKVNDFLKLSPPITVTDTDNSDKSPEKEDNNKIHPDTRLDILFDNLTESCNEIFATVKKNMNSKIVADKIIDIPEFQGFDGQHFTILDQDSSEVGVVIIFKDEKRSFHICLVNLEVLSYDIYEVKLDLLFDNATEILKTEGEFVDRNELLLMVTYRDPITLAKFVKLLKVNMTNAFPITSSVGTSDSTPERVYYIPRDSIIKESEYSLASTDFLPRYIAINAVKSRNLFCLLDDTKKNYTLLDIN